MKWKLQAPEPPEPDVLLTLTVPEFVLLTTLAYRHLGGDTPERSSIQDGFTLIEESLGSSNQALCARAKQSGWYDSRRILALFRGDE